MYVGKINSEYVKFKAEMLVKLVSEHFSKCVIFCNELVDENDLQISEFLMC